jgi:hypothetical protein
VRRGVEVKKKKQLFLHLLILSVCVSQFLTVREGHAEEGKATVGFYDVTQKQTEQRFPKTGDQQETNKTMKLGIFILLIVSRMVAYRIQKNEERL